MRPNLYLMRIAGLLGASLALAAAAAEEPARVSRPGEYRGYAPVLYDGHRLESLYVPVRDGTLLAVDIVRPTLGGRTVDARLPVVWMNTPYNRRDYEEGWAPDFYPGAALGLVKHGYVVAVADMRGNGASFGNAILYNRNQWMPWAYWDAYDITEWLAGQPWSDGRIGMWGCSATGHTQWQAATSRPPHLKAIFPLSAPSEYYDWGGIAPHRPGPETAWPGDIPSRDANANAVDGDAGGVLLAQAREEHRRNMDYGWLPFRDSPSPTMATRLGMGGFRPSLVVNTFAHFAGLNAGGIPTYQGANYGEDIRVKQGVFVKHRNLTVPRKLVLGPGNHCNWTSGEREHPDNPFDITTEELRWFDYWLKGIDNGILDEPPIYYFTYNARPGDEWRFAWQWPLPTARDTTYYFAGGRSLSIEPAPAPPDSYAPDYTATRATSGEKGVSYTTPPLGEDLTLTGHPVLDLWITSTATDGDFLAFIADVAPDGSATLLPGTDDGQLRASHRRLNRPPYDNLGLPYHRSFASDVEPLVPGKPARLTFDLAPVSWVFQAGHRVRITIINVAAERRGQPQLTLRLTPAPTIALLRDSAHASRLMLPEIRPLSPKLTLRRSRAGTIRATVAFDASLDRRYLEDLRLDTIRANGVRPLALSLEGRRLELTIPSGSDSADGLVTVEGSFGMRHHYGDAMRFVARAAPDT